jgi:hypothetical protein
MNCVIGWHASIDIHLNVSEKAENPNVPLLIFAATDTVMAILPHT